ncbi:MAG: PAS domain-containing sensor histidine kinase [Hydrogenophilaceae bacterium]|jgi:two-component system nitrogen regulation sensor histidine kinase NtrY|nr:PAS domain-containing sensor histidine kinase [Hydrogenophilaceae bacterium]
MTSTPIASGSAALATDAIAPKRRSKGAIGFAVGFAVAALLTGLVTFTAVSGGGLGDPGSPVLYAFLGASLLISVVLVAIIVHRIVRIARGHAGAIPGARLHLKFVAMFSLAAMAPAVIVALFMGAALTQGLENWFSARVRTVVERGAGVGAYMVDTVRTDIADSVRLMANDLNQAAEGLRTAPETYGRYLAQQAEGRFMVAAYVINREGDILARAESNEAPAYSPPSDEAFAEADSGDISDRLNERTSMIRALTRLEAYDDAYLYVARPIDPQLLTSMREFSDGVDAYREAEGSRRTIQNLFALSYFATAVLVLLGAVWLGLSFASRISDPIGRLAGAARRVAQGDLGARVVVKTDTDEVDALGVAFNQMTAQLESQRADLVSAQREAEARSRFTQAVLGGVSAGVIGLDRDGRITSANRSACQLLGIESGALEGRRLIDVAPAFAELLNQPTPQSETPPVRIDMADENGPAQLSVRMNPVAEGGVVLTFDDVTKEIAAQRQEAWKDVARRIAHEIRNPLTPIQLSAERLQRKYGAEIQSDPETFKRCIDTIQRQVADIGRMVEEFNELARMPAPRMAFADMSEIARAAVFSLRLAEPDVRFEAEGVDAPIGLVCDERLIAQALLNLLKNAAESVLARRARDGEPKDGWVVLRLTDAETGVVFEVIDNGAGFPPHDRARLLEPYITTRAKGTGLGLAIVSRVVEDHGGLIELADAPNPPGALVRFILPKRSEAPDEAQIDLQQGAA